MVIPKRRVQRIVSEGLSGSLSSNKARLIRRKSLFDKLTEKDREDVRLTVSYSFYHCLSPFVYKNPLQIHNLFRDINCNQTTTTEYPTVSSMCNLVREALPDLPQFGITAFLKLIHRLGFR